MDNRPSSERVEEECMIGLALKLDTFALDFGLGMVNLMTDQLDTPIVHLFERMIERTKTISKPKGHAVKGFDSEARKVVHGNIRIEIKDALGRPMSDLDSKHIGTLVVFGKDDPLVFAADVVVNALHHHLSNLPSDAPLNHPLSIVDWELGGCVYGVRDDAIEDKI
jgi:hypothetical protein